MPPQDPSDVYRNTSNVARSSSINNNKGSVTDYDIRRIQSESDMSVESPSSKNYRDYVVRKSSIIGYVNFLIFSSPLHLSFS